MRSLFISLLLLQLSTLSLSADLQTYYKDFMEAHGYPLEENLVLTDDGYILSVWHLTPKEPNGRVVSTDAPTPLGPFSNWVITVYLSFS